MVEEIDTMVSRIREELHSLDIDRETYIFYLSDHVDIGPTALGMCGIETPPEMVGFDYSHLVVHPSANRLIIKTGWASYLRKVPFFSRFPVNIIPIV
jgi:arylsulfatase A-like enzyme